AAVRPAVLVFARDAVLLGDVLTGVEADAERSHLERVRQRDERFRWLARIGLGRLAHEPRLLRHRLASTGDVPVAHSGPDVERRLRHGFEAGGARADHGEAGDLTRDPCGEPDVPAGVAAAAADRLAEDNVVVVGGVDAGTFHRLAHGRFSERPSRYRSELTADPADRCADRGEDDGVVSWHAVTLAPGRLRAPEGPRSAHP